MFYEEIEMLFDGFKIKSKLTYSLEKPVLMRTQDYSAINESLVDSYKSKKSILTSYHHTGWAFIIERISKNKYNHITIKFPDIRVLHNFTSVEELIVYAKNNNHIMNIDEYMVYPILSRL